MLDGLLTRIVGPGPEASRATVENPNVPLSSSNILSYIGIQPAEAGVPVSPSLAIRLGAVWACLRVRGEAFAALPCGIYQRSAAGGRREVREHELADLLIDMVRREALSWHVDGWGNGYWEILRSSRGDVLDFRPLLPNETHAERSDSGALFYLNTDGSSGVPRAIPWTNVVHVAGPGWDGLSGYPVLSLHADTIGYALAARRAGSRLLRNDARPAGVVEVPHKLAPGASEGIRSEFEAMHRGDNQGRIAVLGVGSKYQAIGLPPNALQFIEQMEWGLLDICRVYMVPPHKVGFLRDAGDRANIEHENLRFATDVLAPAARRFELAIERSALSPGDRDAGLYVKVDLRGVLRGDFKSRMEGYAIARTNGLKNANEIRELEDEPPISGRAGEVYLVPLNLVDASEEPEAPAPAPDPEASPPARAAALEGLRPAIADAARRVADRERQELLGIARRIGSDNVSEGVEGRLAALWQAGATRLERSLGPIFACAGVDPPASYWADRAEAYRASRDLLFRNLIDRAGGEREDRARALVEAWPDLAEDLAEREIAAAAAWKGNP